MSVSIPKGSEVFYPNAETLMPSILDPFFKGALMIQGFQPLTRHVSIHSSY